MINEGRVEEAVGLLEQMKADRPDDDVVCYELGNAYWKMQNRKLCLDNYTEAIRLNPQSPAVEMKRMVIGWINYLKNQTKLPPIEKGI